MLRRCDEAGVATDAIHQFVRMLSKQEKKTVPASARTALSRYSSSKTPKTKFFPDAKHLSTSPSSSSSSSSLTSVANDGSNISPSY